jgi:predicted ATP-dependent endonuclease of OLD family
MFIKEFRLRDQSYNFDNGAEYLSGFRKLNIFVGANNSGKSRFIRQIFKANQDEIVYSSIAKKIHDPLRKIYKALEPRFQNIFFMKDLKTLSEMRTGDYVTAFNVFFEKIEGQKNRMNSIGNISDFDVALAIKNEMLQRGLYKRVATKDALNYSPFYIPILRGARHLDNSRTDYYLSATNKDYKFEYTDANLKKIFSGLSLYEEIKKMLLGSKEQRKFVREFEVFLSKSFFSNREVTLIPDHDESVLKINLGDGLDREIFNVGDGIQSIIIITFLVFKHQNQNVVLFIEEPELMMHPSVQRVLIETLIAKFGKLQIFLTTHSNHFLDLTYDYPDEVAIYSFEKSDGAKGASGDESFVIKSVTNNVVILDILGIRNSSVFLTNSVIWTEGVTDRMLVRKLLELSNKKSTFKFDKEDYHYTFAEYGGSNLENFDFLGTETSKRVKVPSVSKTNFLIADNDGIQEKGNPKYVRRKNIEKILGKKNFFDDHIEIENLVPYEIWKTAIVKLLADHEDKSIQLKGERSDRTADEFNSRLGTDKIGDLLKEFLIEKKSRAPKYFLRSDVMCLGEDKKTIMEYVINSIDELGSTLSDFPKSARSLVKVLKKFIVRANTVEKN